MKIRTIHHQAATGGTLICKCIAALSSVELLSEINPLGNIHVELAYTPREPFQQYRTQYGVECERFHKKHFLNQIELILDICTQKGKNLVIRDHSYLQFVAVNKAESLRRPLLEFLDDYEVLSIVTIRDPIDSYLSGNKIGWLAKHKNNFNSYCKSYNEFMENYKDTPYIRYEDFCQSPKDTMKQICEILQLTYEDSFVSTFFNIKITGDSGRSSSIIEHKERRPMTNDFKLAVESSPEYALFCKNYGY